MLGGWVSVDSVAESDWERSTKKTSIRWNIKDEG